MRGLFVIFTMFLMSTYTIAGGSSSAEEKQLSQLMKAMSNNDYESFIADGNAQFKSGLTKQAFKSVVNQVGHLILGGYKAKYLTELNKQGNKVFLWRISYKQSSDNMLAKLVMIDGKVAGFWLQ